MRQQDQHVVANMEGGWSVKAGGAQRSTRRFKDRDEAISFARDLARGRHGDVYLHRTDGTVDEKIGV